MNGERKCDGPCREWKPISAFYSRRGIPPSVCRSCQLTDTVQRERAIPSSQREKSRRKHLKKNYGITPDQVARMFQRQEGCCCICRVEMTQPAGPSSDKAQCCVDHCHVTGKV